jgi:hypothetical protein
MNDLPLFLHTAKFGNVKSELTFSGYHQIGLLTRGIALAKVVFYLFTFRASVAWEHCQSIWTGYQCRLSQFDPKEAHQWKLLLKVNLQKQIILQSQKWEEVLTECPETFQFAPEDVKKNEKLAILAIQGNPAMVRFVDKSLMTDAFMSQLAAISPLTAVFVEKAMGTKIVALLTEDQKAKLAKDPHTGISALEKEHLDYLITSCTAVWQDFLTTHNFVYLKKREINASHAIQLFKDGTLWIHGGRIGSGSAKQAKLVNEWKTKKQLAKLSILTKGPMVARGAEGRLADEVRFAKMLKGRRGIVQMVDTFSYPSRNQEILQGKRTVLIQERYSFNLNRELSPEILGKWTENDVRQLTLDLLYGLKAFKDANLYDGDFNFGNILVQLDEAGHVVKAGFTDFEQAEVLTEQSRKEFTDPLDPEYEIQTKVIECLYQIYAKTKLLFPEILKEGFYKKKDYDTGLRIFGQQYIQPLSELKPLSELPQDVEAYLKEVNRVLKPYYEFEHRPTKTVEEIIVEMEKVS